MAQYSWTVMELWQFSYLLEKRINRPNIAIKCDGYTSKFGSLAITDNGVNDLPCMK